MFDRIISPENLFAAWREFRKGKGSKRDVQTFEWQLEDHVFELHESLKSGTYQHGGYESFYVCDPKRRHIHKPSVRDRLLHHAIFRVIEPLFDRQMIFDAWSCRKEKGTHRAIERFQSFAWKLSQNHTKTVWVLKLDVRSFFESVDQAILLEILAKTIHEERVMDLMHSVVGSFPKGIPLGNLTSQLFANVYLNELDQFVKHELYAKYYLRYCDDFVLLHHEKDFLERALPRIQSFLTERLHLTLHPRKILLGRYHRGIDFLGFVCFPFHRVLRTKTRRRMMKRLSCENASSYFGLVGHVRGRGLREEMKARLIDSAPQSPPIC